MEKRNKTQLYSAFVWLFSALALLVYCVFGFFNMKIPGIEQLVLFISSTDGHLIFLSAFLSAFIEGFYVVGTFFPGSTLIVIVTVLSQVKGVSVFFGTIIAIFTGWCAVGVINIWIARLYRKAILSNLHEQQFILKDKVWTTWFPAFRANYEVSQIVEGGEPWSVFFSSVRVKLWASGVVGLCTFVLPYFIDINKVSNKEGFISLLVIGFITLAIGMVKIKHHFKPKEELHTGV